MIPKDSGIGVTKRESESGKLNAFVEVDKIALETGISDLARHHDHYLYGIPKK